MNFTHLVVDALRGCILLALALAAVGLSRRSAAAGRRVVLAAALAGALVMPLISAIVPAWHVPSPIAVSALRPLETAPAPTGSVPGEGEAQASVPWARPEASRVRAPGLSRVDAAAILAGIWAIGALAVVLRLAIGLAGTRGIVRRSAKADSWSPAIDRAERMTKLRADVRVTGEMGSPAVTGIFAPVVLVPRAAEAWDDDRRTAVLVHELTHVRHRDCLVHIVAQLACALHWFDPLAWVAARRLRLERELAADDAVLAFGTRASSYAADLLAIASAPWPSEGSLGALGIGGRSQLEARVTAIASPRGDRRGLGLSRGRATLLAAAVTLVACGIACTTPAVARPSAGGSLAAGGGPAADLAAPTSTSSSPELQRIADEELDRLMTESGGAAGLILVLDPSTGEILADAGRAHGAPADVAVEASYVPGSTLKAVTLAGGLEDGMVSADERFDCEQGTWSYRGQVVHDSETHGVLTVPQMLAVSSNVGFVKVFDRMGVDRLDRWLRAFHFGVAPAIAGAATGSLPEKRDDGSSVAALTAIGEGATASPLQVAAAYAVFANDGEYVAPTRARRSAPAPRERLVKPETARAVVRMLEEVVYADRSTGHKAQVEGFRVAGKTGTASWSLPGGGEGIYASFVGIVPSASPRLVILVGVEQPKGETAGGLVAAPVFARVAARALAAR